MRHAGVHRWVVVAAALVLAAAGCGGDPDPPTPPTSPAGPPPATGPATPDTSAAEFSLRPVTMPEPGPGRHELVVEWGGDQRQVLLDAPDSYQPGEPVPLVLVLHGAPGDPAGIRNQSGMAAVGQEHGLLVAYPAGHLRRWRANPGSDSVGDLSYLTAVVDLLVAQWDAAPEQVYAAGFSSGAAMAWRLAVEAADVFAAVAPVSGSLTNPPDRIVPAGPVAVVGFVGLSDRGVVSAGSLDTWRGQLDCPAGEPQEVAGAGHVTRIAASCPDGSEVVEYQLDGVGHVWPNQDSHGLGASELIGDFFAANGP